MSVFWAMAAGLASSTGCYLIGIAGSIILAIFLLSTRKTSNAPNDMMLVIRGSQTDTDSIHAIVSTDCDRSTVKAKNILSDSYELVYEVRVSMEESSRMTQKLFRLSGVDSVNLLAAQ